MSDLVVDITQWRVLFLVCPKDPNGRRVLALWGAAEMTVAQTWPSSIRDRTLLPNTGSGRTVALGRFCAILNTIPFPFRSSTPLFVWKLQLMLVGLAPYS